MSYILDALKKSEEKRGALKPSVTPSVMNPESEHASRRFIWPLMLIIAALLAGWLFAQWQNPDISGTIDDQTIDASPVAEANRTHPVSVDRELRKNRSENIEIEQLAPVAQLEHIEAIAESDRFKDYTKEKAVLSTPITPASVVIEQDASPHGQENDRGLVKSAVVPSLNELTIREQQSIPAIKIEGHIYDVEPAARMVIINGKVRREKQTIASGLVLQKITSDGVIMNYQGRVFHMGVFDQ